MDDAFGMRGVQRVGNLDCKFEYLVQGERLAGDYMLERAAVHEFHGDELLAVLLANIVDGANVWMIQCGGSFGCAAEALQCSGALRGFRRKKLERNEPPETGVFGFVDDAHATAAQLFQDAIVRNRLADHGRKRPSWRSSEVGASRQVNISNGRRAEK